MRRALVHTPEQVEGPVREARRERDPVKKLVGVVERVKAGSRIWRVQGGEGEGHSKSPLMRPPLEGVAEAQAMVVVVVDVVVVVAVAVVVVLAEQVGPHLQAEM